MGKWYLSNNCATPSFVDCVIIVLQRFEGECKTNVLPKVISVLRCARATESRMGSCKATRERALRRSFFCPMFGVIVVIWVLPVVLFGVNAHACPPTMQPLVCESESHPSFLAAPLSHTHFVHTCANLCQLCL